jgi:hypothetical protein
MLTVTKIATGTYVARGLINPADGWAIGDTYHLDASWSMAGTVVSNYIRQGDIEDKAGYYLANLQTFSTSGTIGGVMGSVTGSVGSVTNAVTLPATAATLTKQEQIIDALAALPDGVTPEIASQIEAIHAVTAGGVGPHAVTYTITDAEGGPVAGALVQLRNGDDRTAKLTDVLGVAVLHMTGGVYSETISKTGFYTAVQAGVIIAGDVARSRTVEAFVLQPSDTPCLVPVHIGLRDFGVDVPAADVRITLELDAPDPVAIEGAFEYDRKASRVGPGVISVYPSSTLQAAELKDTYTLTLAFTGSSRYRSPIVCTLRVGDDGGSAADMIVKT